ncbi:hypothetical protein Agub_g13010 [Astrephomene gubernaculifera]|uniref:Uncharacterized protein n=1 Tax=Astrephomene gubernaculifera TaxID=47775 RepID=A0AAD3DZ84_9CHLO|nr:hypothetical protein Agub_g13010 [Astrephomene gubernaculifera]
MAASGCSHGGANYWLSLMVLLLTFSSASTLRPRTVKRKGHTLDDLIVDSVTAEDVQHNDAMRFVREGIEYMHQLGIRLSDECEKRYGYTFITDQKFHHFRMCTSEAKLNTDGTLSGAQRGSSALLKLRTRYEKQMAKYRKAAAVAKLSNATVGAAAGTQRRSVRQHDVATGAAASTDGPGQHNNLLPGSSAASAGQGDSSNESSNSSHRRLHVAGNSSNESSNSSHRRLHVAGNSSSESSNSSHRRLHVAGNSSSGLIYKILNQVNANKANDGETSDAYDDDADSDSSGTQTWRRKDDGDGSASAKRKGEALGPIFEPDTEVPELTAVGTSYKSSVGCYLQPLMPRNVGYKDAQLLCVGRNVVLDSCALYDGQHEGFEVRFPKPKSGALKLGCGVKVALLGERNLTKGYKNRMWWMNAQDNAYEEVRSACDPSSGRVVEHPVAFVLRDRYTHTLHELEVLATIFTSLAVADLPEVRERGVQLVIADQMPHASYRPTYAAISYPYRLRHLAEAPYPPNTCFRTALFINAFTNSIAFNPNPNTSNCFSPVMIGVHRWLRTLHKELDPGYLARAHQHASETGGIVRRSVVWTSRRNLEALRLTSGAGMTEWQSARMVPNENQVVTALQSAILEWNSRSCLLARYYGGEEGLAGCRESSVQFDLVFGEFSDWPYYPDQLMTIYRTGVLIGVHGAALTFVTSTTAGESALLELAGVGWEDTQTGNMLNLFPSLAHNVGAYYEQVRYQGPDIDIKIATDALIRAMDEVSRRITARQRSAVLPEQQPHFNDQYNFDIMFPQACPTTVPNKLRRYVTSHPVQMSLNGSSNTSSSTSSQIWR